MEALFTRHLWILDIAVVVLCAALLGHVASTVVDMHLGPMATPKPSARLPQAWHPTTSQKDVEAILRRNIFCSSCPPILEGEQAQASAEDPKPIAPQPTALPLRLTAVMYGRSPSARGWNTAIIRDNETKSSGAFSVGEHVHGATLTGILATRVYLDHSGAVEYLDLLSKPPAAAHAATQAAPRPSAPADPFSQELDRGIKKVAERKYEVQRTTLEAVLGNMALLSRSARIIPELRGGKPVGFRLSAVRSDGPLAKIGLQNGDLISSINGLEITSPEKALEVYAKLKSANHLALGLERNGQKTSSDYDIR